MDKIENYIIRFFKKVKMKDAYDMPTKEFSILSNMAKGNPINATGVTFLFGYVKGYRAAMAEMKKGGAA